MRNIITSMRLISDVDWTELFERVSLVDDVFKAGSAFEDMDFRTRNLYRNAVEHLARGCELTELEVAHTAVETARRALGANADGGDVRLADPGYYLIAGGRVGFEAAIGFRPSLKAWPGRAYRALGIGGYVGAGTFVAAGVLAVPLSVAALSGVEWRWLLLLGILGFVPAIDLAVAVVNYIVTRGFRATLLPALELRGGVPVDLRTLVAVPTLLTSLKDIEEQIGRLEIHYLASAQGELHFALLSDWRDAPSEHVDGDEELLAAAKEGIARLNQRYGPAPGGDRFLLLHRRARVERRRRLLYGVGTKAREAVRAQSGPAGCQGHHIPGAAHRARECAVRQLRSMRTRGCRAETVGRLIGKMAHPLNRPRLDAGLGRVVEGYGILQPRVTPALPVGREGSLFLRVFSSATGIDPYAAAVSDVYQDLFGEGSYTARASTTSTLSRRRCTDACPIRCSSAMTCSRASSPAPAWRRTWRSWRIFRLAMTSPLFATTAGREATGSCFLGSSDGGLEGPIVGREVAFPPSVAGRCSTTCGGRCRRRRSSWP